MVPTETFMDTSGTHKILPAEIQVYLPLSEPSQIVYNYRALSYSQASGFNYLETSVLLLCLPPNLTQSIMHGE